MANRAFVSFQMEDRWARDFLRQHARSRGVAFEFIDFSLREPFESRWKGNVKRRIAQTRGTLVMIGPTTFRSDAVLWEIAETKRQGNPIVGVQINRGKSHRVPTGVPRSRVIRWHFASIERELMRW